MPLMLALEEKFHNATTRFFTPKSMTMASAGAKRGKYSLDSGIVASKASLDLANWEMHLALYHLIRMVIEMASKRGACFSVVDFMPCIPVAKRPCYGRLKIKPSYNIVHFYVFI